MEKIVIFNGQTDTDQYDNFYFFDAEGTKHKIGAKRENFHDLVQTVETSDGKALKLTYSEYKGKFFITGVDQVEKLLAPQIDALNHDKDTVAAGTKRQETPYQPAPQELGMWWKEMGNRIGDGSLDRDYPQSSVGIKEQYYSQMFAVTKVKATD